MASKRNLKRTINYVLSDLFAEGIALSLYGEKKDQDAIEETLSVILKTHRDFISRVSHVEPGMKPKKFYKTLIDDFNSRVDEIIDQFNAIP